MFMLNGYLSNPVKDDGHVTPAGPLQALFTENERETALAMAKLWYAKGYKPRLVSYDGNFATLFDFRNYDRAAKAKATKRAKKLAA